MTLSASDSKTVFEDVTTREASIVCCYENVTPKLQVVRITNIPNWYFEKVVFPKQRLLFEALPHASLEVYTGEIAQAILADHIPCDRLQISPL
jgi:Domain of unknown function (DUF1830)